MTTSITLETERLRLRPWQTTDYAPFAALNADEHVMHYFPQSLKRAESDAMLTHCQQLIIDRGWGFWAVETKDNHQFIGLTGLHIPSAKLPFSPCVEVGWRFAHQFWGHGYATEAAKAALEFGFKQLTLQEIVSFTAEINLKSRSVMHRLGMTEVSSFEHPLLPKGHWLRPHVLYRLRIEQFIA